MIHSITSLFRPPICCMAFVCATSLAHISASPFTIPLLVAEKSHPSSTAPPERSAI